MIKSSLQSKSESTITLQTKYLLNCFVELFFGMFFSDLHVVSSVDFFFSTVWFTRKLGFVRLKAKSQLLPPCSLSLFLSACSYSQVPVSLWPTFQDTHLWDGMFVTPTPRSQLSALHHDTSARCGQLYLTEWVVQLTEKNHMLIVTHLLWHLLLGSLRHFSSTNKGDLGLKDILA